MPASSADNGSAADAEELRNYRARRLLRQPLVAAGGVLIVAGTLIGVGVGLGPAFGALAALIVLGFALWVVNLVATRRADREFFAAYAAARGLNLGTAADRLPPATPLLRQGTRRFARDVLSGTLPGGVAGTVALYTYVEKHGEHSTEHPFTVALYDLPGLAPFIDRLYCERRQGLRLLDSAEDSLRVRNRRIELESEEVDRRYEIFAGAHEDPIRVREVFEPSFVVWLADGAPEDFAFELEAGALCCSVAGHRKSAAAIDGLCEAAATVARRLGDEAAE